MISYRRDTATIAPSDSHTRTSNHTCTTACWPPMNEQEESPARARERDLWQRAADRVVARLRRRGW